MTIPSGPSTIVTIARWASQILGVAAIAQLAQAVVIPEAMADMFGLPLSGSTSGQLQQKNAYPSDYNVRRSTGSSTNVDQLASRREKQWLVVYTSRNAVLGLLILTLGYGQNDWKAVGTVFKCTMLAGVTDMVVAGWQERQMGRWAYHAAGTAALAMIGFLLG
ncbi:hypothetical protein QFC21_005968 [Naganishia friedmannii]|uniref:Uncharacterized protein n=1 Tax=Naganishia friedmannii TaxID=89922 RepID=A0ACC2V5H7_9TREE|nr:hypothetical protein QFC21_005968 [Naganishia friedmannii]